MEKLKEFLAKHKVKLSLTVVALGVAATLGFGPEGCTTDVAPAPESVVAPAAGGAGGTEAP